MGYGTVAKKHDKSQTLTTPSAYGSHKSMVVDPVDFDVVLKEGEVICKDDLHFYITTTSRLDDGLADVNRYGKINNSLQKIVKEDKEE